jgi:hypothetical protein
VSVQIRPFLAGDIVQLALQPSQHVTLGMCRAVHGIEDGVDLEQAGPAWTAIGTEAEGRGRILCCYGFTELWPAGPKTGGHALAWAMLASGLGSAHLAITRFARRTIAQSPFTRIEAIVRANVAAECSWARLCGFTQSAELRAWGPDGETHLLFERVRAG